MSGKAIRETLAALGVIASMVFVELEIRQNTAVARGQTRQDLAALNQEYVILIAQDAEFSDLFARAWILEGGQLSDSERFRASAMMTLRVRLLENVYLQYAEGLVDVSALGSYGGQASSQFQSDRFREWWTQQQEDEAYNPDFVQFFNEQMGLTPP